MMNLPIEFEKKMKAFLGNEWDDFLYSYDNNRFQALRFNTLKVQSPEEIMRILNVLGISSDKRVSWANEAYYFDENGDMVTGWFQYNRVWYYLDPQVGKVSGGWLQQGDDWYYMNPDGSMAAGWLQWQGSWYYLDPSSGQMVRDKAVDQHYVNQAGIWVP